jgi:hypothetical protein
MIGEKWHTLDLSVIEGCNIVDGSKVGKYAK